jgi:hypothetical protein
VESKNTLENYAYHNMCGTIKEVKGYGVTTLAQDKIFYPIN